MYLDAEKYTDWDVDCPQVTFQDLAPSWLIRIFSPVINRGFGILLDFVKSF